MMKLQVAGLAFVALMALAGFAAANNDGCNVCWKWTLAGCKNNYYGGSSCRKALKSLSSFMDKIDAGWAVDSGCDKNTLWVCGSFDSQDASKQFYDEWTGYGHEQLAMSAVFSDFCDSYPGSTVSIKAYDYPGKYDMTWGKRSRHWQPPSESCSNCDIDITYTCQEHAPPPVGQDCGICLKWTLSDCADNYYDSKTCSAALQKLSGYMGDINQSAWTLDAECQGNSLWICGTFSSDDEATTFYNDFTTYAGQDNAVVFEGVADSDFCSTYPGSTITIQTYDYPGKYDKTWGSGSSGYTWSDNTCSIDVDMTYTCPETHAPPPADQPSSTPTCDVCWEWEICNSKYKTYYSNYKCSCAIDQILNVINKVNDEVECISGGFTKDTASCDGNRVTVCGSFESQDAGLKFVKAMQDALTYEDQCNLALADSNFCKYNPGATITLKSSSWDGKDNSGKYDQNWDQWHHDVKEQKSCEGCSIDATVQCNSGWSWTNWRTWKW